MRHRAGPARARTVAAGGRPKDVKGSRNTAHTHMQDVVWRTSGDVTLPHVSECHREYLQKLVRQVSGLGELHVLVDLSLHLADHLSWAALRERAARHERELTAAIPGVASAVAYTVADVVTAFPHVEWPVPGRLHPLREWHNHTQIWLLSLQERLRARGRMLTRSISDRYAAQPVSNMLGYFIHEPSLCLWLRRQPSLTSADGGPRYIWVIEDDTLLIGSSLRAPLLRLSPWTRLGEGAASVGGTADLVSVFQSHSYVDDFWWLYLNRNFSSAFPGRPLHRWEHVERYSSTLLREIEDLLERGVAAYGEVFSSTVCERLAWCERLDLRDTGFVPRDGAHYADSSPLSSKALTRLEERASAKTRTAGARSMYSTTTGAAVGRWVHAVKEGCTLSAHARA